MTTVSIIGIGRVGGALALALDKKNYQIENLLVRDQSNAARITPLMKSQPQIISDTQVALIKSDVIFITTQDPEIIKIAELFSMRAGNKKTVFHTSGSLSSEVLQTLKKKDFFVGSIHPLVSVSDSIIGEKRFANSYFCVEGDIEAVETAKMIVGDLDGKSFQIETKFKTLYHAAAVTACGHLVATIDTAIEMMEKCGIGAAEAQKVLLPLIKSTVENLEVQTASQALTGTFARTDAETFERHRETMRANLSSEICEIYYLLGLRSLKLAEKNGADKKTADELRKKILLAKNELKC